MPHVSFAPIRHCCSLFLLAASLLASPGAVVAQNWSPTTASAAGGAVVDTGQVRAELLAHAPEGAAPGQTVWLGLLLDHAPKWHTYWLNPGDSGLPTELQWTLPAGVTAGPIQWPTPTKFPLGTLANYGYGERVLLPVPLTISQGFQGTHIDLGLFASWLACRTECIPEEGQFGLRLPVNTSTAQHRSVFEAAWALRPVDLPADGQSLTVSAQGLNLALSQLPRAWQGQTLEVFPETPAVIEPGAPWTQSWRGDRWSADVPLSAHRSEAPTRMAWVIAPAAGGAGVRFEAPVAGSWPAVRALPVAIPDALKAALDKDPTPAGTAPLTLWMALVGALIGGLILNLMPCVFPVLAIKVLSFAQLSNDAAAARAHRWQGVAYTAGVVLSFVALGALLLSLRAAGEQLGWGFQLQSPAVVAALAVLFTLIGLNLVGLFEFGSVLPSSVASWQARNPTVDAFFTGVLATAIASPCTAPFMGASLGLAIALPAEQALMVFSALGLGMAMPYLLASWWPAVARALPRPGAWMNTLRHGLSFPMFATVVWLLWVLGQQSGIDGAAALLMLLVSLSALVWAWGLNGGARKGVLGFTALVLAATAWTVGPNITREAPAPDAATATAVEGVSWQAWTAERQATALAQGRAVFVDFTAAWCVTCQYNKRTTLSDPALLQNFAQREVTLLRADWTRRDPAVTQALTALGRSGVPVYALYRPNAAPVVLSELISVADVRAALAQ
ncbi:MAG: protein-disulfide reductase DsbD family protein [Hydrogenophaga sp.]|nr:protein-disulfide reductase DsbD family protein [Hydrogenophaga sp.]